VGPLGTWLGERNEAWSWVLMPDVGAGSAADLTSAVESSWATGDRQVRFALLRRIRSEDPAAGLALVRSTWSGEKAADRSAIIEALAPTLPMVDEPFLEETLDDRAKSVREQAASLLATLPGSRLAERAAALLAPLVSESRGLLRRKVEVALPGP